MWTTFDRRSRTWTYDDADKDSLFVVVDYTITTKHKDPILPRLYLMKVDKEGALIVSRFDTRFYRWTSRRSYLGLSGDSSVDMIMPYAQFDYL